MNIKKIASAVLAFCLVGGAIPLSDTILHDYVTAAGAEEEYTEGTYGELTYRNYGDYIEISGCDDSVEGELVIPSEIDGVPVTGIKQYTSFAHCQGLTSVTLSDNIISFDLHCFEESTNPITVNLGINTEEVRFWYGYKGNWYSVNAVNVPEENQYFSSDDGVLYNKDKTELIYYPISKSDLDEYNIPDTVTEIGNGAFFFAQLKSITIPDSVQKIGEFAFCNSYIESINIPYGIKEIEEATFNGTPIGCVDIPESVTKIDVQAFGYCTNLTAITFPDNITFIEGDAFCGSAWYDNQPDGLIYIGNVVYEYKGEMPENTIITLKDGTVSISGKAFANCSGLTSITIPNSVHTIGDERFVSPFYYCSGLTSITLPDSITCIKNGAFSGCSSLTSITIPDSVTSIEYDAFERCSSLTSVTIPDSVTSIGEWAFAYCSGLTSITITNPDCEIFDSSTTISSGQNDDTWEFYFTGTIYGYKNSTAQAYAEKYGLTFVSLGEVPTKALPGDTDLSGEVEIADAVKIMCHVTDPENNPIKPQGITNGDVYQTGDGLSVQDALSIQKYLAQIITELPEK